jgi:hypothetical protein
MKIRILGKQWNLAFCPEKAMGRNLGLCDPPTKKGKEISILETLRGKLALDTVIHECLHASSFMQFDEQFVDTLATDIARAVFHPPVLARILDDPAVREVLNVSHGPHREVEAEAVPREAGPEAGQAEGAPEAQGGLA